MTKMEGRIYTRFLSKLVRGINMLERVDVSTMDRIRKGTGSSGCQRKWELGNRIVKLSILGYEHVAEVLVSELLECSNLRESEYVKYFPCDVYEDGVYLGQGCYSYSFLCEGEQEVSIANILDSYFIEYSIKYDELIDLLYDITGINQKPYIDTILALDTITRNDDRHFRNISFIKSNGLYRPAPIFDNGGACMSDCISYPLSSSVDELWGKVYAKPFSVIFGRDLVDSIPIGIDVERFAEHYRYAVGNLISKRAFDVILRGLKESEGLVWVRL